MLLSHAKAGQSFRIQHIHLNHELESHLAALGLRVGAKVTALRRGLFRGPLHVRTGSTELMLRLDVARHIKVAM